MNGQPPRTPRDRLIIPVAAIIGLGWLASLVVALTSQQFEAMKWTTPALMLLAGYVFGVQIVRGARTNGGGGNEPS